MQLDADQYGSVAFVYEQPTVNIAGKKIALSFSPETEADEDLIASYLPEAPADNTPINPNTLPDKLPGYLIHMVPELVIGDDIVNTASAVTMGSQLQSSLGLYSPSEGWTTSYNKPIAGEYAAIAVDLQGIASEQLDKVKTELEAAQANIESEDFTNITKHSLTGNMLYSNVLSYFALNNVQDELSARSADIVTYRAPSLGLFRTQLDPLYQWGVAKEVSFPGMVMDIDQVKTVTISKDFDLDKYRAFNQSQGTRYSYMEGFVPEQFFSTESAPATAVSAVSAIAQASAEGQKILTLTPENQTTILPLLTIDQIARDEIVAGLNAGKEVTVHESPISVGTWSGSGYIVLDTESRTGAYKISGGDNGGRSTSSSDKGLTYIGLGVTSVSKTSTGANIKFLGLIDCNLDKIFVGLAVAIGVIAIAYAASSLIPLLLNPGFALGVAKQFMTIFASVFALVGITNASQAMKEECECESGIESKYGQCWVCSAEDRPLIRGRVENAKDLVGDLGKCSGEHTLDQIIRRMDAYSELANARDVENNCWVPPHQPHLDEAEEARRIATDCSARIH